MCLSVLAVFTTALATSQDVASFVELQQDRVRLGARTSTRLTTDGGAGSFILYSDTVIGTHFVDGIGQLGLGGSDDFRVEAEGLLTLDGRAEFTWTAPSDPDGVGRPLFLQAATVHSPELVLLSPVETRRVERRFDLLRIGPTTDELLRDPVWTLEFDQHLDPRSLEGASLFVRDVDTGGKVPLERQVLYVLRDESGDTTWSDQVDFGADLDDGERRTVVQLRPLEPLAPDHRFRVVVDGAVTDLDGIPLLEGGKRLYRSAEETVFPALLTDRAERNFLKRHVDRGEQPYSKTWIEIEKEADQSLNRSPDPHSGPPPNDDSQFAQIYARWYDDMRWAYSLSIAWGITREERYRDKSLEFITAWTDVFEPERVGGSKWARSIFYDIGGIKTLAALEWVWDGLNSNEQQDVADFFDVLATSVAGWHEVATDSRVAPKGTNIKSWDNTVLLAVSRFFGRNEWYDYVYAGPTNPWTYPQMLDDAINEDGSVIDEYRKSENPWFEVTYPVYHLQALALFAEIEKHHGVDAWDDVNSDGNGQYHAWRYYFHYVDGSWDFPGDPPDYVIEDSVTSKYYNMLEVYREQDVLDEVAKTEPGFDVHIWNRAAGLVHRIQDDQAGTDTKPPRPPINLEAVEVGVASAQLRWEWPFENNEDQTVFAYRVYLDGDLQSEVTCVEDAFVVWGMTPATEHDLSVRAVDFGGNESDAAHLLVTTDTVFQ